ncbi:MAG TPA: hypothetical protein VE596_17900 [Gaiellaceae bacterium]|nr:hypothetical protein [Gaiellaceae bacterium]
MIVRTLALLGLAAVAIDEPAAFGTARLGSLTVTASVLVSAKAVDMRGVWNDTKVACTVSRPLRVRILVDRVAGGKTMRVRRAGTFRETNCAEGGPNVGFTIKARSVGLACPNGRWKPGLYHFLTRAKEPRRELEASASLDWQNTRRC